MSNYLTIIYSELQNIEKKYNVLQTDPQWLVLRKDIKNLFQMAHPSDCGSLSKDKNRKRTDALPEKSESKKHCSPGAYKNNSIHPLSAVSLETSPDCQSGEVFSIHNLLQSLTQSWKLRYSKKGFRLIYINQTQECLALCGTPCEIIQIFNNLLSNAYETLEEKKRQLSGHPRPNWFPEARLILMGGQGKINIKLTDNGCGIPGDIIPHIFKYGMTTKPAGHGIGLSIVKELTLKYHGQIEVHSIPSEGSVFQLSFPAAPEG